MDNVLIKFHFKIVYILTEDSFLYYYASIIIWAGNILDNIFVE